MERRGSTNPHECHPGLIMLYPGFSQNKQTQPGPRKAKENTQLRPEEMWHVNQSISTPQNYGRNYLPPQMPTGLCRMTTHSPCNAMYYPPYPFRMGHGHCGIDLTSHNACRAMDYTPYHLRMGHGLCGIDLTSHNTCRAMYYTPYPFIKERNAGIQVPNYNLSNLDRLEMFAMSKAIGEINSSGPSEKSATGCRGTRVPPNNHGVQKIGLNRSLALGKKSPVLKEGAPYEVNGIGDIRGCKRKIHLLTQEDSSQDQTENQSVKRTYTTEEFHEDVRDCRPMKTDDNADYIDVETVDDGVEKDGTCDDPDETSDVDVVGLSDDEKDESLVKVS